MKHLRKRVFSMLLCLVMLLGLFPASAFAETEESRALEEDAFTASDEQIALPNAEQEALSVAMITDMGSWEDGSFNQATYEACRDFCQENGLDFQGYQTPEDSEDDITAHNGLVRQAITEGANIIVLPGFGFAPTIGELAPEYPEVKFVGLDISAWDAFQDEAIPDNVVLHLYREEQAGYLAGYAAVKLGYTKLGFLGGMAIPSVMRYGYGFVQGADAAAAEIEEPVRIYYAYAGQFYPSDELEQAVLAWYEAGTQAVFACGGGIWGNVAAAAAVYGYEGKVIGVDVDQKDMIDSVFQKDVTLTSAMKNLRASVFTELNDAMDGSFAGGQEKTLGIVSADPEENFVGIAPSTPFCDSFSEADYVSLLGRIVNGELSISDDTGVPPTAFAGTAVVVEKDLYADPNEGLAIDESNFPDEAFRTYVAENLDPDKDGVLTDAEIAKVTQIACAGREISSLQGIGAFTGLKALYCEQNRLTGLDVSGLTALEQLWCYQNQLESLNVSGCTALVHLRCNGNASLSALDLSTNANLQILIAANCPLGGIDVSHNPKLEELAVTEIGASSLDVSHNPALQRLACHVNQLTSLDVSHNPELSFLSCDDNLLSSLDVSANTALTVLGCTNNQLTSLDLSANAALTDLYSYGNQLTSLDLRPCPALAEVARGEGITREGYPETALFYGPYQPYEWDPDYTEYRLSADAATKLITGDEPAPEGVPIDEAHFPDEYFRAYVAENLDPDKDGTLTAEEIAGVTRIECRAPWDPEEGYHSTIKSVAGIEVFPNLEVLSCGCQELTELDLSANPALTQLFCEGNQLTSLDVSGNPALYWISCNSNELTELKGLASAALQMLDCSYNQLTELELGTQAALHTLGCENNRLTELDVSACPGLQMLDCSKNELTGLDLGNNARLDQLFCYGNSMAVLDLSACYRLSEAAKGTGITRVDEGYPETVLWYGMYQPYVDYPDYTDYHLAVDASTELILGEGPQVTVDGIYADFYTFEQLKDLIAGVYGDEITSLNYRGEELLDIPEDITIPEKYDLVTPGGGGFRIEEGVTMTFSGPWSGSTFLTVDGTLVIGPSSFVSVSNLSLNGSILDHGRLSVHGGIPGNLDRIQFLDDGTMTIVFDVELAEALEEALAQIQEGPENPRISYSITAGGNIRLEHDLVLDRKIRGLDVEWGGTLTVPTGVTLTVNSPASLSVNVGSVLTVEGQLVNNSTLMIQSALQQTKVIIAEGGVYSGEGSIQMYVYEGSSFEDCVQGLDLSNFDLVRSSENYRCYTPKLNGYRIDADGYARFNSLEGLQALAQICGDYELVQAEYVGSEPLSINGDTEIPENLWLSFHGKSFVVEEGVTFTVEGQIYLYTQASGLVKGTLCLNGEIYMEDACLGLTIAENGALKGNGMFGIWVNSDEVSWEQYLINVDAGQFWNLDRNEYGWFLYLKDEDGTGIPIDEEHFPDENFRAYVAEQLDLNGDTLLGEGEIAETRYINCSSRGIASLEGIEIFDALQILVCGDNALESLDLSRCAGIITLDCSTNSKLTQLNLGYNPVLSDLDCSLCPLESLDVSGCPSLEVLNCNTCGLRALDLSANPMLNILFCAANQLTGLDLSGHDKLERVTAFHNQLGSIGLSGCSGLKYLFVQDNQLSRIDLSETPLLEQFYCQNNPLSGLDLSPVPGLNALFCFGCGLTELKLVPCPALCEAAGQEPVTNEEYGEDVLLYGSYHPEGYPQLTFYRLAVDKDMKLILEASVQEVLEEIPEDATPEEIRETAKNLDDDAMGEALLDDSVAETVKALEEQTGTGVEIEVTPELEGKIDESQVAIVGAALNTPEDEAKDIVLKIGPASSESLTIPTDYVSEKAVLFSMTLENVENTKALDVPVRIDLPVPEGMNPNTVVLLHYTGEGEPEVIKPQVVTENGVTLLRFVLTGFSDFALAAPARTAADVNADGTVNGKDLIILRRYVAGVEGTVINELNADMNGDGTVNGKDLILLRRLLAG